MTTERPRLRVSELALLADLVELRDRSHLALRYDDEFAVVFIGDDADLTHPSFTGSRKVSMRVLRRYRLLGLLELTSETDVAWTFGLVDGIHDQLDVLRRDAGLPSQIGEAVSRAARAEGRVTELEAQELAGREHRLARARRDARRITRAPIGLLFIGALAVTIVNVVGQGSGVVTAIGIGLAGLMLVDYFFGHSAATLSHRFEEWVTRRRGAHYERVARPEN